MPNVWHYFIFYPRGEEASVIVGAIYQWEEEEMPRNTNKLVHFCRTSLLHVFHTHISQRFSSEGPRQM